MESDVADKFTIFGRFAKQYVPKIDFLPPEDWDGDLVYVFGDDGEFAEEYEPAWCEGMRYYYTPFGDEDWEFVMDLDDEPAPSTAVALKYDGGKPRVDLLPSAPLLAIAEVLGFGADKYAAHNWRKGMDYSRLIGAAYRHLMAYNDGQDKDPESGLSHLAHAGCCILFLLEQEAKGTGTDDRFK